MIVMKTDYLGKIENLLNDADKFEKINFRNGGIVSFTVNQEKRVDNILKKVAASNGVSDEARDL